MVDVPRVNVGKHDSVITLKMLEATQAILSQQKSPNYL